MLWMLEPDLFAPGAHPLRAAARRAGHQVIEWDDGWWASEAFPATSDETTVFHGSLGNAARVARLGRWRPGALCAVEAFTCSQWYPRFAAQLVHRRYRLTTVRALCETPSALVGELADAQGHVFVRPDSPLKPFSGRVVELDGLTPGHLDHGFYFDDLDLPIVVAPTRVMRREWRFVLADARIVAETAYIAEGRQADSGAVPPAARAMAEAIATSAQLPAPICIVDIGEADDELCLLEFNPFSGADLYACDLDAVVAGIRAALEAGS